MARMAINSQWNFISKYVKVGGGGSKVVIYKFEGATLHAVALLGCSTPVPALGETLVLWHKNVGVLSREI